MRNVSLQVFLQVDCPPIAGAIVVTRTAVTNPKRTNKDFIGGFLLLSTRNDRVAKVWTLYIIVWTLFIIIEEPLTESLAEEPVKRVM